ncbi:MAG: hypothetical protein VKJ46_08025 [Leptolyngbyaceae bacterium]|nr:hypothetical protein [Leptolyngbyaceae bacterium]
MSRLLYEKSVSYRGCLIIPFILGTAIREAIYSYRLLSEAGHQHELHKAENPAGICSSSVAGVIAIAQEHLDRASLNPSEVDHFKNRYTYRDNLIIVVQVAGKFFYDHYPPDQLNNIAAPKLFTSEQACIDWIKEGLDRAQSEAPKP